MKYPYSIKLVPVLGLSLFAPLKAQVQTVYIQGAKCENGNTTSCTVTCGEVTIKIVYPKGNALPEQCTQGGSYVENGSFRYAMSTMDYAFGGSGSGCAPCGSSISNGYNNLPSLELQRNTYISVTEVFTSFGNRSGFAKYDDVLIFENKKQTMTLRSPGEQTIQGSVMTYDVDSQMWQRITSVGKNFVGVSLYRQDGSKITSAAQRNEAYTAVLLDHDGSTRHFELIRNKNGGGVARLSALLDRYGNQETIAYTTNHVSGKVKTVANYFRKKSIADAYGRAATFTTQKIGGSYVITSITTPSGENISYTYNSTGEFGNPFMKSITRGNGSVSTWDNFINPNTRQNELTVTEAYADPTKRRKTIFVQGRSGFTSEGNLMDARPRLTRRVDNGDGEARFANRIAAGIDSIFTYQGGNKSIATIITGENNGFSEGSTLTKGMKFNEFMTEDVALVERDGEYTQENTERRKSDFMSDPLGRTIDPERNPLTQSPTSGIHIDGYTSSHTYDTFDQPELTVDSLGRKTMNTYDGATGVKLFSTRGLDSDDETTSTYVYNDRGQMVQSRDALYDTGQQDLHNTIYVYDNAADYDAADYSPETFQKIQELLTGNDTLYLVGKIESADKVGDERPVTKFINDSLGRVIEIITPPSSITNSDQGRETSFEYDFYNRLVKTTYSDSSTEEIIYGEPGSGRENLVVEKINRNGISTTYEYDESDRRVRTVIAAGTTEESVEVCTYLVGTTMKETCTLNGDTKTYLFDHRNRVIGMKTQADAQTELVTETEYDVVNRSRSTTDAYGRKTFYLYDQNDRLIKTVRETFPGAVSAPAFDAQAQQTSVQKVFTFTDKAGNTLSTAGTHEVTYTCPRDLFLSNLQRSTDINAAYIITETLYDSEGQMVYAKDANGNESFMQYDELGRQTLSINALGTDAEIRSETLYDDNSNVIESRGPRFFAETNTDGTPFRDVNTYTYNGRNNRQSHTTATGSAIAESQSWTYYLDGKNNQSTDFRGNSTQSFWHFCCGRFQAGLQQDGTSASISNTDYNGNVTHTAAVQNFDAITVNYHNPTDADTLVETTTRYDGRNRPTFTTRWLTVRGVVNDEARLNLGNGVIPIAGQDGIPASEGLTSSYEYDENLTDGVGIDAEFATQFAALTTRYGYNPFAAGADGFATKMTNPAGEISVQVQDGAGRAIMSINPEGDISTMDYDAVVALNTQSGTLTIAADLLATSSTDANDNTNTSYSDGAGRTLASEDALGNFSVMGYDANSNLVSYRDPNGIGQDCVFDTLNRDIECTDLQEAFEVVSRTKAYNAASQVILSTDAEGEQTTLIFDERGRVTSTTDANNITVAYTYDANNNLASLTNGEGNTRSWTYDERNLKVQKTNPGVNDILTYTYDALGRLVTQTDQLNDTCTHFYDLASRMVSKEYKTTGTTLESTDTFVYDAASRLIESTKGRYGVTTQHSYALDSMPITETLILDNDSFSISRSYDAGNRPTSHTFADGNNQSWSYDARNLVTKLTYDGEQVLSQSHDAGYRLSDQTLGNSLQRQITYGRLDNLRTADTTSNGSGPIAELNFDYAYLADKNVQSETTLGGFLAASSFTASYDAGNRLTNWNRTGTVGSATRQTEAWAYDDAGNQINVTRDGTAQARTYNIDDELTGIDGDATELDAKGNMIEDADGNKYFYDLDNRINEIKVRGGATVHIRYDAMSRRVISEGGNQRKLYLWWGDQETAEHQSNGQKNVIQNDLWAHPTALNQICARALEGNKNEIQYYHKNYLDHVYAVSDDNGNLLEHYRYTAFGEVEIFDANTQNKLAGSAIGNPVLWNSRRFDADTGLYYYKYRHYKADIGRWLGRDPIEEDGGINLYGFVGNDTVNLWDVFGLADKYHWNLPVDINYYRDDRFGDVIWHGGRPYAATSGSESWEDWLIRHRVEFKCDNNKVTDIHALGTTDIASTELAHMNGRSRWTNKNVKGRFSHYNQADERWTDLRSYSTSITLQGDSAVVKIGGSIKAATKSGGWRPVIQIPTTVGVGGGISVGLKPEAGDKFKPEPNEHGEWGRTYKFSCLCGIPIIDVIHKGKQQSLGKFTNVKISGAHLNIIE